jgi:predicted lipid-binding transport protein (Tim44 family)
MKAAARSAAVAAAEDPAYDPDGLVEAVIDCYFAIEGACQERDPDRLAQVLTEKLAGDVGQRGNVLVEELGGGAWLFEVAKAVPEVRLVGVVNRPGTGDDQVVAHLSYELAPSGDRRREYWTLRRQGGRWKVAAIETSLQGTHHLTAPLIAEPWADHALRDQSMLEVAAADPAPAATAWSELVADPQRDPPTAVRELALVDARFSEAALESMVRTVADAWVQAALGASAALRGLAEPEAARTLTRPRGSNSQLIVRGLKLRAVRVVGLELLHSPPTVTVEAAFRGRRALRNRGQQTLRLGSLHRPTTFRERWTFALCNDRPGWQLIAAAPIGWERRAP